MAMTYQQPQYNGYAARQDGAFANVGSGTSYVPPYYGTTTYQRSSSNLSQLPSSSSNTNPRQDSEISRPLYSRPTSPEVLANHRKPVEEMNLKKTNSSDSILPNLQIPRTINTSGGSLAEFAAQVGLEVEDEWVSGFDNC